MSTLYRNELFSRRGFIRRTVQTTTLVSAAAGFSSVSRLASGSNPRAINPWAYDDTPYRRTDPNQVRFQETSRFQVARKSARCLCLTKDERLLIGAGNYVMECTLDGQVMSEFALADEVRCVAATPDDLIYVGFRDHIEVYNRQGKRRASWESPGPKSYFTAVAVAESDVFVADAGSRLILRYASTGLIKGRIGERRGEVKSRSFIVPSPFFDVEVAPDGLLRVSNPGKHCVEAYTFAGDLEFSWGKAGAGIENFCGCCNPINLALLRDGRVITFEKGIPRVKVYSIEGRFESVVAGAESFAENAKACGPNDCTLGGLDGVVDSKGGIHILDFVAGNVRTMEPKPEVA